MKLKDIYECMKNLYHLDDGTVSILMRRELETEQQVCFPNSTIVELIQTLKENGKTVIFTSDMYLDKEQLQELITTVIPNLNYDDIYVSSELGLSKSHGDIYDFLKDKYSSNGQIIHIGDYFKGDYLNAKRNSEFDSILLRHSNRRLSTIDKFITYSVSDGKSCIYRWAYQEFAPALWKFCEWVENKSKEDKCDQLIFLAREGAFLKKLFDLYCTNSEITTMTFYASRRSVLASSSDINWDWMPQFFENTTVGILQETFHIYHNEFELLLAKENITRDTLVKNWSGLDKVKTWCNSWSLSQRKIMMQMLNDKLKLRGNIGIVDVGWKGSTQYFLQQIFEASEIPVKLHGFYLGEFTDARHHIDKQGFLCSSNNITLKEAVLNAGFIFENCLSPLFGTTVGYRLTEDGKASPILDQSNVFEDEHVKTVQMAIIDYFKIMKSYKNHVKYGSDWAIRNLFIHLNHPSYAMACMLGDIRWKDFEAIRYVAKPKALRTYLQKPGELMKDIHECGWNSAFCLRVFRIPFPYFEVYTLLKKWR